MKFSLGLIMPFPGQNADEEQRVYNYRHSRSHRVVENAFGFLAARWRIFQVPIQAAVENVESCTLACFALHNYVRLTENAYHCPAGFVDSESGIGEITHGNWQNDVNEEFCNGIRHVRSIRGSKYSLSVIDMRENLKNYLNSEEGRVPWQLDYVRRTAY